MLFIDDDDRFAKFCKISIRCCVSNSKKYLICGFTVSTSKYECSSVR